MSFNWLIYKYLHPELKYKTQKQFEQHYLKNNSKNFKKYTIYEYYSDFNALVYKNNYSDLFHLNIYELELHWLLNGSRENRTYYNILSDINKFDLEIIEDINLTNKYIGKNKKILIIVNNHYKLDTCDVEESMYLLNELLQEIAYIMKEEDEMKELDIDYIVNISAGDIITKVYLEKNIQNMEEHNIMVMKPNCFHLKVKSCQ